jgi:hypothetical protein
MPFAQKKCRGCDNDRLVWAATIDGRKVLLDPVPPLFEQLVEHGRPVTQPDGTPIVQLVTRRTSTTKHLRYVAVSHFSTCPNAGQFSKGREP